MRTPREEQRGAGYGQPEGVSRILPPSYPLGEWSVPSFSTFVKKTFPPLLRTSMVPSLTKQVGDFSTDLITSPIFSRSFIVRSPFVNLPLHVTRS
jgi:hypothetical protein